MTYKGPVDEELETELIGLMMTGGYEVFGSAFNIRTGVRTLQFERRTSGDSLRSQET